MKNLVGKRVREARHSASPTLTQAQLAARLQLEGVGLERVGISKIETGTRPVADFELVAIAKALDTTVQWLLGESEPVTVPTPSIARDE